jgi:uncharacterized membrane protein
MLPNTAYLFTDIARMAPQWPEVSGWLRLFLIIHYLIVVTMAVVTLIFACLPFERLVRDSKLMNRHKVASFIVLNLLIGFGVVLGRWEHINSYVIITNPGHVFSAVINIFTSVNLFALTVLFGLICTAVYLPVRTKAVGYLKRLSPTTPEQV